MSLQTPLPQHASPSAGLPPTLADHPSLDTWVRLTDDETITLFTGKVELGQGLVTAIARIGAEELDVALDRIRVRTADTVHGLNERLTAASLSISDSGSALRQAAAEARAYLLTLAATRLGVAVDELVIDDGTVSTATGQKTTYWELLPAGRFGQDATGAVAPKAPSDYRIVGHDDGARLDITGLVTGTTKFVTDLEEPRMLHARVVRSPNQRARLEAVDIDDVRAMDGIVAVIRDGDFIAVVAEREEQALRGHDRLNAVARWSEQESLPDQTTLPAWLLAQPTRSLHVVGGAPVEDSPGPLETPPEATSDYEATFSRPFQMHGSIGASAALAVWTDGKLHVKSHTQGPFVLRDSLAQALGVDRDDVRVTHVVGPGCYGHNGADDAALDAALAARAVPGRPVLLKWTRTDEHGWEPYGAPAVIQIKAHLADNGSLLDWSLDATGLTHNGRPFPSEARSGLLAAWTLENPRPRTPVAPLMVAEAGIHRNATPAYRIPRTRIMKHLVLDTPLRTSSMRALGAYANVFAIESAMDELAELADRDPLDFRLAHLDDPRARSVLQAAAERASWADRTEEPGHGMGLAYGRYKNKACHAAVVVKVAVDDETAEVRLEHAVIAADAGQVVDPVGLVNQLEGGLVQSASWTLHERVSFDRTRVTSLDWDSYPILRFTEVPEIETVLLDQPGQPFLGSGEATQGPTAAAIANAIYAATGVRVRDLPITPEQLQRAALGA
jgi:nicotinate dehydrogenase subunit B